MLVAEHNTLNGGEMGTFNIGLNFKHILIFCPMNKSFIFLATKPAQCIVSERGRVRD